ncbi:hypothetical protein ABFS82_08G220800 [Erythranthe guttata]|uniref:transcription factor bHLH30-like n=1 Tax=Erythranthe guttata TaxID=4155 RepID=UPI00064DE19A|nr:PREDICTED: transcription factor bHLH30-like [Erythranthe guttata]|eukprot:XP_012844971.1 PREDICTED: transcription factor bHLH30-like [Erythranthe guttata]
MFSIPSLYELGACSDNSYDNNNNNILQGVFTTPPPLTETHETLSPGSTAEAKAAAASNSHKEAERRRRKRINGHIATLKSILPNTIKTDKASLLGEAVKRVKELNKKTAELTNGGEEEDNGVKTAGAAGMLMIPSETDELKVSRCEKTGLTKASLSCDDRAEIITEMITAVKAAEGKVVRAEMSTVGGRTKSILWVKFGGENDVGLGTLRRGLRMVMDKSTLLAGSGQGLPGNNKRARYYHL